MKHSIAIALFLALAPALGASAAGSAPKSLGTVYTTSNAAGGNEVLAFRVRANGALGRPIPYATGGLGSGGGLGNQGGLVLSPGGRRMLAVNAGSDEISLFRVRGTDLELLDVAPSGGRRPVSIALRGRLVYVLNAGGAVGDADNVTGFRISESDEIEPIAGSTRALSAASTGPAQIAFSPDGDALVVTERMTDRIVTYLVDDRGIAGDPIVQSSAGRTPFGFTFDARGRLLVSEASGGDADASALSSYELSPDGQLDVITASAATTETAACWAVATPDARFAYVTNTASGSISGFKIRRNGSLRLLTPDGVTGSTGGAGSGPIDLALTADGRILFDLRQPVGAIGAFVVLSDGRLKSLGQSTGIPTSANGLVAR